MKSFIIPISLILFGFISASAKDCGPTLQSVAMSSPDIYTHDGRLYVDFDLDISALEPGKTQEIIYTPVLMDADGSHGVEFGKIVVKGRNAAILAERHGARKIDNVALDVAVNKGNPGTVSYSGSLPYEQWMELSDLYLVEDLCGCGALKSQDRKALAHFNNKPVVVDDLTSAFVEPKIEQPKIRNEKGSAYIDFVVNKYEINPKYHNNAAELSKITSTIDVVKNNKNVEITNIDIHGFASPEGPYDHNVFLAKERTAALSKHVMGLYTIPGSLFSQHSTPEDWEGFKKAIEDSNFTDKAEILALINNERLTPDVKEDKIRNEHWYSYEKILENIYPYLRRSDYTISYEVRPFSAEEALEVMKTNPKHVSLYEMFWAAQSLGISTDGYNDVIELAVATYPDEPVANYNAAIVAINKGDYDKAKAYLAKVPETGETLNMLGIIALNTGNSQEAEAYFKKAVDNGFAQAADNMRLIEDLKRFYKQNR